MLVVRVVVVIVQLLDVAIVVIDHAVVMVPKDELWLLRNLRAR